MFLNLLNTDSTKNDVFHKSNIFLFLSFLYSFQLFCPGIINLFNKLSQYDLTLSTPRSGNPNTITDEHYSSYRRRYTARAQLTHFNSANLLTQNHWNARPRVPFNPFLIRMRGRKAENRACGYRFRFAGARQRCRGSAIISTDISAEFTSTSGGKKYKASDGSSFDWKTSCFGNSRARARSLLFRRYLPNFCVFPSPAR